MPWTPLEGSPAARWAAAARFRTVPPMPTSRRAPSRSLGERSHFAELPGDVLAQLLELLALGGSVEGQEALAHPHRPSRQDPDSRASRSRTPTSCIEPPPRSSTQPSLSVVELTAAR